MHNENSASPPLREWLALFEMVMEFLCIETLKLKHALVTASQSVLHFLRSFFALSGRTPFRCSLHQSDQQIKA